MIDARDRCSTVKRGLLITHHSVNSFVGNQVHDFLCKSLLLIITDTANCLPFFNEYCSPVLVSLHRSNVIAISNTDYVKFHYTDGLFPHTFRDHHDTENRPLDKSHTRRSSISDSVQLFVLKIRLNCIVCSKYLHSDILNEKIVMFHNSDGTCHNLFLLLGIVVESFRWISHGYHHLILPWLNASDTNSHVHQTT
jgi:hypothetical protein